MVDLQKSKDFRSLGVDLLSIATDPVAAWKEEAQNEGITSSLLSDDGGRVAESYGVMRWAMGSEPGHTFVLVGKDGRVLWLKDYGAPQHGGLMYVAPGKIANEVANHLSQS